MRIFKNFSLFILSILLFGLYSCNNSSENSTGDQTAPVITSTNTVVYNENEDALYVNQYFDGSVRKISDISDYERPRLGFKVFPNPASVFTFVRGKLPAAGDYNISIFDIAITHVA